MLDAGNANSLDEILCDPALAAEFDAKAQQFAPGFTSLQYRWAALTLRKAALVARTRAELLKAPARFGERVPLCELDADQLPESPGVYVLSENQTTRLYAGETLNLRNRLSVKRRQIDAGQTCQNRCRCRRCQWMTARRVTLPGSAVSSGISASAEFV